MVLMPSLAVLLWHCSHVEYLGVGVNGINALASHVVKALQPCGTL